MEPPTDFSSISFAGLDNVTLQKFAGPAIGPGEGLTFALGGPQMTSPTIRLNDGRWIPQIGFGSALPPSLDTAAVVREAIEAGYRHIDTAKAYMNDAAVGEGVRTSGVARPELFVTSKLFCDDQGYDATRAAFDATLKRMGLDYLDLYLIHWPNPDLDLYVDTWRAMIRLRDQGLIGSIGVSNFEPNHIERLVEATGVAPAVNQVELNPRFQQRAVREAGARYGVVTEAWSPLVHGALLKDGVYARIAGKHGRSPAQIILRWHIQKGLVVIPMAERRAWMEENLAITDFALDEADVAELDALDQGEAGRWGPHPLTTFQERAEIVQRLMAQMAR